MGGRLQSLTRHPATDLFLTLVIVMVSANPACAAMKGMEKLNAFGHVEFRTSCFRSAQADIDQGVAALYSFAFDQSRMSFERASLRDPGCAIAYWGDAMSDYEQIEGSALPEGAQLEAGQRAIAQGRSALRQTIRERAYIDAIAIIYDVSAEPSHDVRVQRFSAAMRAVSASYPRDRQAAVIYAMSLLKDGMPTDSAQSRARRSLTILNGVLKEEPDNPGVIHFIIHAADNPRMAALGLDAARRYARVAPAAPHALHMPGHIFARLGLWKEDIVSNQASATAARQPSRVHSEAQNLVHALEFLQYAYLQIGREDKAKETADQAARVQPGDFSPGFRRYFAPKAAGFPARQALETRDWGAAEALSPSAGASADARRVTYWAQAVAAGHLHNPNVAAQAEARFLATYDGAELAAAQARPSSNWTEVQAWTLFAKDDVDSAVDLLRPVAERQDTVGKGEVELPAREMIGDMLRLSGRLDEALNAYRASLRADPGRFNTLLHAGEVASRVGRKTEAARVYRLLLKSATDPAPISRAALERAQGIGLQNPASNIPRH